MPKSILYTFFGFKHLIKAILSINHAASSGGNVCNASDSLMMQFQKDVSPDPDCHNFPSRVVIDKVTGVIGYGKASSRLRDMSTVSSNA